MRRVSVLVVDDSVVVRRLVSDVLSDDPDIEVVGTAANGRLALAKIPQVNPDLVTLDIEMPEMDGLAALRELRKTYPRLPVIMFSTLTERGAAATLDALSLGANDYVTKPANVGSVTASMDSVWTQLIPKIKALGGVAVPRTPPGPAAAPPTPGRRTDPRGHRPERVDVLAIGTSTGGPDALSTVLAALPADLPVPVVIVQHMPPVFTRLFAERLDNRCALQVREAENGDRVRRGLALIAPGDFHLRLAGTPDDLRVTTDKGTPENFCRPAVDVLFRSVVDTVGSHVLGVVLTGMGSDGLRGARRIVESGGEVFAQDQATSVVWGMPGVVAQAGLASQVLPLPAVAPAVVKRLAVARTPADRLVRGRGRGAP